MPNYAESLPGINTLSAQEDIRIQMQGVGKPQYFASGGSGWKIPNYLPKAEAEKWKQEFDLCNCNDCYDRACVWRGKNARFPVDAGGQDQCLRLMQTKTAYAFRNGCGTTITIPDDIVRAIREGGTG